MDLFENVKLTPRGAMERAFALQLRYAMNARKMTQNDLVGKAQSSAAAVRNYLMGKFLPRPGMLAKLEDVLQFRFVLDDQHVVTPKAMAPNKVAASAGPATGLTITAAKEGLAANLGVDISCIEIIVRS
jgi:transcriptional regulator with XRE-family HTH domain